MSSATRDLVFAILFVLFSAGMAYGCFVTTGTGAVWPFGIGTGACLVFAGALINRP